jgi:cephalosporin hydroxylase
MSTNEQWKIELRAKESTLQFFHSGTTDKAAKPGDKWEIPNFLKQTNTAWAKTLIEIYQHPMSFPGSVSPQMGNLLRALIMNIAPKHVIEIGSFIGVSSLWIASAMVEYERHHTLHCIDLFPDHTNNPWCPNVTLNDPLGFIYKNIRQCGFQECVEIHKGDSNQLLPDIINYKKDW